MRVFVIGGFGTFKQYYIPLRYLLSSKGITLELLHPGPLGLNIWPLRMFEKSTYPLISSLKEPVTIIGHSLGGIQAVRLAELYPDKIKKIIAIASPIHGSPWPVYENGIRTLLDVPTEEFDRFREQVVPSVAQKLVTISTPHDMMAPIDKCTVEGAKNYVIDTGEDFQSTAHVVIPFLVVDVIEKELRQP